VSCYSAFSVLLEFYILNNIINKIDIHLIIIIIINAKLQLFWVDVLAWHAENLAHDRCHVDLCTRVANQITDKRCRRNLLSETCITRTFTTVPRVALTL